MQFLIKEFLHMVNIEIKFSVQGRFINCIPMQFFPKSLHTP